MEIKKKKEVPKRHTGAVCRCATTVLSVLLKMYDWVVDRLFDFFYSSVPVRKLPPVKNLLLLESAVSLAEKIRKQEVTSEKIVTAFIDRIKEVNPFVNAVVDEKFDKAISDACAVDEMIKSGSYTLDELKDTKPLLGIPFTSKESTAAEGFKWSLGLVSRKNVLATFDAEIVKGLKNAGAILVAVTNIPELNLWVESRNCVYGQTSNPYNTNRMVGGSSGGEACIVTACGSPIGLGTDIGGSCRIPAYCCGVFGHKMTGGLINTLGMTFRTGKEKHTIVAAGPITKHAVDLKLVIQAVLSRSPDKLQLLDLNSDVDLKAVKYYYTYDPEDNKVSTINPEIKNAMFKIIAAIKESSSVPPQELNLSGFKNSYNLWRYWMSREESNFAADLTNNQGVASVCTEVLKLLFGLSNHTLASILKLIDLKLPLPSDDWAEKETNNLRAKLLDYLGNDGVLLFPSCPTTASYHYRPYLRPYNFAYWAIFNALEFPVTQVPIGLSVDGLPLGIQVVAGPNQDRLCIAVSKQIEEIRGGWVPAFQINIDQAS